MELTGSMRATARALVAAMAATLAVSCSGGGESPTIRVGAGNSAQSDLIARIYAQALARTGAHTAVVAHVGQRADYLAALDADRVTLVGDDSGDLLTVLDSSATARLPDKNAAAAAPNVADALSRALPEGLSTSDIADGTDLRPAFVLARAQADRYPGALPELAPHCAELTVGIATGSELDPLRPAPDPQRDVLAPLREQYHCDITHYTIYPGDSELRKALADGRIQAGVLTAPAALLPGGPGDLVPIADPSYAFRAHNIVPLFRQGALTGAQIKKLNYVAGELTTADLADLIGKVRDEHAAPDDLARGWLDEHNL
ncbi:transporter [Nocardia terpenica]|uniref:glycine betaine ABC transporter substrate-binding protein n=1 Tax=Nocardia terpenica TaxID=455432 RepID=UPI0018937C8F|nr:glycine betaine ABC transporter substrate-binding protein [Nocardia terpenica]MBF6060901.1 transporter [Nocardia terpenica]MBF6104161.1 transporter [Nocardia terpenica]MBF6111465.1 transporter [Nocardia terpenica]MBF6118382.1 transporter [Nocardia terpenica]MBF6155704.1 transporter [Nocardia terpenica]